MRYRVQLPFLGSSECLLQCRGGWAVYRAGSRGREEIAFVTGARNVLPPPGQAHERAAVIGALLATIADGFERSVEV